MPLGPLLKACCLRKTCRHCPDPQLQSSPYAAPREGGSFESWSLHLSRDGRALVGAGHCYCRWQDPTAAPCLTCPAPGWHAGPLLVPPAAMPRTASAAAAEGLEASLAAACLEAAVDGTAAAAAGGGTAPLQQCCEGPASSCLCWAGKLAPGQTAADVTAAASGVRGRHLPSGLKYHTTKSSGVVSASSL